MRIKPKTSRKCKEHGIFNIFRSTDKCPYCEHNKTTAKRVQRSGLDISHKTEGLGPKMGGNRIKTRSAKKQEEDRKVSAIKVNLIKEHGLVCQSTGKHGAVELSHIVPRSLRPDLITTPLNCMIQCHEAHEAWEHKVMDRVAKFKNLGDILKRLKQLDYPRYEKVLIKLREHSI